MTVIDGPSIHPLSGNKAKQLIIFCHGYGADGNDLIGLTNYFQQILPDAYFISVSYTHLTLPTNREV